MKTHFPTPPLKIAFVLSSTIAPLYVDQLVQWAFQKNSWNCYLIIQDSVLPRPSFLSHLLWTLIDAIDAHRLKKTACRHHLDTYDLSTIVPSSTIFQTSTHLSAIQSLDLDLLVQLASGPLNEDLLHASRLGVISFRDLLHTPYSKNLTGFWDTYYQREKTSFEIEYRAAHFQGRKVLMQGAFPTQIYYLRNQARLEIRRHFYLQKLLSMIAEHPSLLERTFSYPQNSLEIQKIPSLTIQLDYLIQSLFYKIRAFYRCHISKKETQWGIAFVRTNWQNLIMHEGIRIKNPPGHFLADPFVITEQGRDYCFVEDFDYRRSLGHISVYELHEKSATLLGTAIQEPFHMSFPYLFRFDDHLYMVPETNEAKEIRLYECTQFPLEWKLKTILMSNVVAADTLIVEHAGKWWLFATINLSGTDDHCSELSIFYSDHPLSNTWTPHRKNPIFVDSSKGRNGGILFHEQDIFRVAQRQGFGEYGKGYSIQKIIVLTPDDYEESEICSINPNFFPGLKCTHHLHSEGKISVFDYAQDVRRI